jgi:transcriptional regulator with XRE-family HTH domain
MGRKKRTADLGAGQLVRLLREQKALTQEEFARSVGVSRAQQARIEAGEAVLDLAYLRALHELHDVDPSFLVIGSQMPCEEMSSPRVRLLVSNYLAATESGRRAIEQASSAFAKHADVESDVAMKKVA